jgi:hypothetical protein
MPALLAPVQNGCPRHLERRSRPAPKCRTGRRLLLRAALVNSSYVAVRHEHSRDDLLPFANGVPVEIGPWIPASASDASSISDASVRIAI